MKFKLVYIVLILALAVVSALLIYRRASFSGEKMSFEPSLAMILDPALLEKYGVGKLDASNLPKLVSFDGKQGGGQINIVLDVKPEDMLNYMKMRQTNTYNGLMNTELLPEQNLSLLV
jgi:hypothetical protein